MERLFWKLGIALVAVAIVERFRQELIYGLSSRGPAGKKNSGCCGEMAVSGGSTVCFFTFNVTPYQPNNRVNNTQGFE